MKKLTQVAVKIAQGEALTLLFTTKIGGGLYVNGAGVFFVRPREYAKMEKIKNRAAAVARFNELAAEGGKS